jgi:hypothetical protein
MAKTTYDPGEEPNPVADRFRDSSMASPLYGGVPNKFNRNIYTEDTGLAKPPDPLNTVPDKGKKEK